MFIGQVQSSIMKGCVFQLIKPETFLSPSKHSLAFVIANLKIKLHVFDKSR